MGIETVSFAEFFGDNPRVAERSEEIIRAGALKGADRLALTLRRLIGVDDDILTPVLVDLICLREYERLITELAAKREAGLLNDAQTSSEEFALRGVKMVVDIRNESVDGFTSRVGRYFGGYPPKSSVVESFDGRNTSAYVGLNFLNSKFRAINEQDPSGYRGDSNDIYVYGELDTVDFNSRRRLPLAFSQTEVVRLETVGGDLWQNRHYTPAGLAIATAEAYSKLQ